MTNLEGIAKGNIENVILACMASFDLEDFPVHYIAHSEEKDVLLELKLNEDKNNKDVWPFQISILRSKKFDMPIKIKNGFREGCNYRKGNARMVILSTESTGWFSKNGLKGERATSYLSVRGDLGDNFTGVFRFSTIGIYQNQIDAFFKFLGLPTENYWIADFNIANL